MKLCKICGNEVSGRGLYCSDECRRAAANASARNARKLKKSEITATCKQCGVVFITQDRRQHYCSDECRKKANYQYIKNSPSYNKKHKKVEAPKKPKKPKKPTVSPPCKSPIMEKFKKEHKVYEPEAGDSYGSYMQRQVAKTLALCGKVKV